MGRASFSKLGIQAAMLLGLIASPLHAQEANVLQTPRIFAGAPSTAKIVTAPVQPQIDPASLLRIPVTVLDNSDRCVDALSAGDFSLSVDGEDSRIVWFRPNRATAATLGLLVDISRSMAFKSFSGVTVSKVPFVRAALRMVLDKLDPHDDVFLASFARRFHMLDDFTTDHRDIAQRIDMLSVADQLDDFDGSGIYESLMKGIAVLSHAPKTSDRRALLVFTDAGDSSSHGADDVIARAQFAGVTIYNIIVQGFMLETDAQSISNGMGRIAAETGGLTFVVNMWRERDRVRAAIDKIADELDNQYVLGFPIPSSAASAVPVELTLLHHPGLRVRAPHVVRFHPDDFAHSVSLPGPYVPE